MTLCCAANLSRVEPHTGRFLSELHSEHCLHPLPRQSSGWCWWWKPETSERVKEIHKHHFEMMSEKPTKCCFSQWWAASLPVLLGETHWLDPPTLATHPSNHRKHSYELFYNRRSWEGTNKPPPSRRVWERSRGFHTPEPFSWTPILAESCVPHQEGPSQHGNPETHPFT